MDGETILFVGAHYEVTNPGSGQTVSKYYFAGTTRIAMRKYTVPQPGMTFEYFISDHLGSTSITTDTSGNKVSEMRYTPWGEVRPTTVTLNVPAGISPAYALTKYTFTGQYSYMDDPSTTTVTEGFGLMFYNARFYDPALGRFTSADTIIPSTQGVQGWDRYAYVNNNPLRYTDPTGHESVCGQENSDPECETPEPGPTPPPPGPNLPGGRDNNKDREELGEELGLLKKPQHNPVDIMGCELCSYPPNDFVFPWELDRLDGIGYRFDASAWLYFVGVDFTVDVVYNFNTAELSLLPTLTGMGGLGLGADVSPVNVVLLYDTPNNDALTGWSGTVQGNLTAEIGIQGSYSESASKGSTGQTAKIYSIGGGTGAEVSVGGGVGYTFFNWNLNPFR